MQELFPYFLNGISVGGQYALIAIGYTLVYGILRLINFAHGDVIMVGGYMIFLTMANIGNPVLGLLIAVLFCVLLRTVSRKGVGVNQLVHIGFV